MINQRLREKSFWKLVLVLATFYLIFELLYIFKVRFFLSLSGKELPLSAVGAYAIDWILVTIYMTLISINTSHLLKKDVPWKKIIVYHLFFSILISIVIRFVIDIYQMVVGLLTLKEYSVDTFLLGLIHSIDVNYLIYAAMIFVIYAFHYLEEVRRSEIQKNALTTQLLDTKIKMLTTQLQPHFLFNTLNSISSLIDINKEKAQDTLADLSDFLRQILFHIDSNFVSIREEINILTPYLNILRTRFFERIEIKTTVPEHLLDNEIPTLILQPLVENAVKHGSISNNNRLFIHIKIFSNENRIIIQVFNSGHLKESAERKERNGIGLPNLRNRLINIYGTSAQFSIANFGLDQVVCTVEIPQNNFR